ncbi:Caudovirus prohead protease [Pseudovibrio axinellae]|uniref:Caudovirus prohead protease n=1 Tax=Pseudovibrio axinellae TaxID=989403 RepID=A0A165XGL2_9HYPH|nr:prohead protease/major capsid protein fusion protein [Pseudovibrio axinellae]KZL17685.1 Caudovirus prohead protease [Pseudovibrio axinellae]SER43671.1 hypothetical protein SAMN05421798_11059 [Pseudovibrio axinellae]
MPKRLQENIRIPKGNAPGEVRSATFNEGERTVEVIFATDTPYMRNSWQHGPYNEVLVMSSEAMRMERFEKGMSLLDSHSQWSMKDRLGTIVPGSVRLADGKGYCLVKLNSSETSEQIIQDLRDGHPFQVSVGYRVYKFEKIEKDDEPAPEWRAIDWEPSEISVVPVPADAGAHSRSVKPNDETEFDCVLVRSEAAVEDTALIQEDEDMPKRNADPAPDANKPSATGGERNAQPPVVVNDASSTPPVDVDAERGAAADEAREQERERARSIHVLGQQHNMADAKVRKAIDDGTSVADFKDAILDAKAQDEERSETFPHSNSAEPRGRQDEVDTRREAMTNAVLHRCSPGHYKLTDPARDYRGLTLKEMARECLELAGERTRGLSAMELAERAFQGTSDFPIILEGVVNRQVMQAYQGETQTFRGWAKQATATDFRDMHRISVGEVGELRKVNENGEYESTTIGEGKESYRIGTYGRIIGITRQAIVNDDLNVFNDLPRKFGNQVSILESDVVYNCLVDNKKMSDGKALFHADHKNLLTGAASALSLNAIAAGRIRMSQQLDVSGKVKLRLRPRFILLPTELELPAAHLFAPISPTKTTDTVPEYLTGYERIVEDRLSDISGKAWHMVADPNQAPAVEFAYLEGENGPSTETQMGFKVDGMQLKIRLDFGAAPVDRKAIQRNAGE